MSLAARACRKVEEGLEEILEFPSLGGDQDPVETEESGPGVGISGRLSCSLPQGWTTGDNARASRSWEGG